MQTTLSSIVADSLAAAGQLIDDHQVGVWRYLRALGCINGEAEDLTRETFLAVLRKPFVYYSKEAASSYLQKVAYHRFISARRRMGKYVDIAELENLDESWAQWATKGTDQELLEALRDCLGRLTKRARWALEMQYGEKLSILAIAEHLGVTEHGAKNLLQRAKHKLKDCLDSK